MNRDTRIQKLREAFAAQLGSAYYPTIEQAEAIFDAVFEGAHSPANVSDPENADISSEQMSVSAYTPTDDERALRALLIDAIRGYVIDQRVPYEHEIDRLIMVARASDDYETGYAEGFHHGSSTPRGSAEDDHTVQGDSADDVRRAVSVWAERFIPGDRWDSEDLRDLEAALKCVVEASPTAHDRRRPVQGEPSDARIRQAVFDGLAEASVLQSPFVPQLRELVVERIAAALRAAAETV